MQAAALAAVQEAQNTIMQKEMQVKAAEHELNRAKEDKDKAGEEIDTAAKMLSGESGVVDKLVEGLEMDGHAYVDSFLGEPLAGYIRDEVRDKISSCCTALPRFESAIMLPAPALPDCIPGIYLPSNHLSALLHIKCEQRLCTPCSRHAISRQAAGKYSDPLLFSLDTNTACKWQTATK